MLTKNIREIEGIRLNGRFDKNEKGLALNWTASGFEMKVRGSFLHVEIECDYGVYRPYVSFEVDGLRAQTFAPLKGRHAYTAFCSLDKEKAHNVKLILETQLFPGSAKISVTEGFSRSLRIIACSRPPPPTTSTFMELIPPISDGTGACR